MKKTIIDGGEYNGYLELTRWPDDENVKAEEIIEAFDYLKDKKVKKYNRIYDKEEILENPHLEFLLTAFYRTDFYPYRNKATQEFLESDYLSEELKKEIYDVLNGYCSKNIVKLLTSEKKIKEFTKEEIKELSETLENSYKKIKDDQTKEKCHDISNNFDHYIFEINGCGPIEYLKEKKEYELPIRMLDKSGVPSWPSYYAGYGVNASFLGEKHLFSIYQKFVKFYPDKADEFVNMVRSIDRLTPTEFVVNYLSFARNGFDNNFKQKKGNISLDRSYGETRDLVGAIGLLTTFKNNIDSDYERKEEIDIELNFIKMVREFKKNQELNQSQINEKEKSRILKKESDNNN